MLASPVPVFEAGKSNGAMMPGTIIEPILNSCVS
jgi:hypothetical protein